jgi:hypothetical protein
VAWKISALLSHRWDGTEASEGVDGRSLDFTPALVK